MAREKGGSADEAPAEFMKECQALWRKAMALAGEAYTARAEELEGQLAESNEEIRQLREQIDPLVSTRESQARSLVDLDRQLKEVQNTLNQEREQNSGMQAQFQDRERQLKDALEDVSRVEAKLREAESETLAEAEKRNAAEQRLVALEQRFDESVREAVREVQSELNKASSKLEVITAERDRLNRDLADAFETISMLEDRSKQASEQGSASGALEQKVRDLEAALANLKRQNERLNSECDEFAQKNAELLKRLNTAAPV